MALTTQVLEAIGARNPALKADLHVDAEGALAAAAASDARRAAGRLRAPLDGISLAEWDNIDVAAMPTTAGMATRRGRIAPADAFVMQRLREAGMVLLGILNMHEAALGAPTTTPTAAAASTRCATAAPPAAPAADRPRRWRPACAHWRWAPTPWARCASPRPTAAGSASRPAGGASPAPAAWPAAMRWTTSARCCDRAATGCR